MIEKRATEILRHYEGTNDYILRLKYLNNTKEGFVLTREQSDYILKFFKKKPIKGGKWVNLDKYYSERIALDKGLKFLPEKMWVEKLLAETISAYHIYGKFTEEDYNDCLWIPKGAIIKDNDKPIEIDYSKYDNRPPLEHQKIAIETLLRFNKFILADDMGLGKTGSSIIASLESNAKKILVICPASLKLNWKREFEYYTDKSIFIAEGKSFSQDHDIVIVNYEILKNFHSTSKISESQISGIFDLIIVDEAHMISNATAQRSKLVSSICRKATRVWLLTGTPVTSRPINYFNLLRIVDSPLGQNWKAYVKRYCNGFLMKLKGGRRVWKTSGSSNLDELRERTSSIILRRLKKDILDLPEKIITPIYLSLKDKEYDNLIEEYRTWFKTNVSESRSLTMQLSMITKIRQYIAIEKVKHTIEITENILENDKKVIIFTNFTEPLKQFVKHFGKKCVYIDGSRSKEERQKAVDDFQTKNNIKVFVGNLKAAGVGITLTEADAVIMNDLSFVPSDHTQAEDRAYRYGQKSNVSVFYPLFEESIEMIIYRILMDKERVVETILGDNQDSTITFDNMLKYINESFE